MLFFRNMINCPLVRLGLIINCDIYNICDNLNEYETEGCYSVMPKSYKYTVCPICRERLFNMFIRENE